MKRSGLLSASRVSGLGFAITLGLLTAACGDDSGRSPVVGSGSIGQAAGSSQTAGSGAAPSDSATDSGSANAGGTGTLANAGAGGTGTAGGGGTGLPGGGGTVGGAAPGTPLLGGLLSGVQPTVAGATSGLTTSVAALTGANTSGTGVVGSVVDTTLHTATSPLIGSTDLLPVSGASNLPLVGSVAALAGTGAVGSLLTQPSATLDPLAKVSVVNLPVLGSTNPNSSQLIGASVLNSHPIGNSNIAANVLPSGAVATLTTTPATGSALAGGAGALGRVTAPASGIVTPVSGIVAPVVAIVTGAVPGAGVAPVGGALGSVTSLASTAVPTSPVASDVGVRPGLVGTVGGLAGRLLR